MLSVLSDQRCKYRAFSTMQLPSVRHRDSAVNPCCHILLWLKHSICPSALNTVWGYLKTVPDWMGEQGWREGGRPGSVRHGVCVCSSPHLATRWPSDNHLASRDHSPLGYKTRTVIPTLLTLQGWLHRSNKTIYIRGMLQIAQHHTKLLPSHVGKTELNQIYML